MSIKGTTKELFVRTNEITVMGLLGNSMDFPYEDLKRVDYCYGKGFQTGYLTLVSIDNKIDKFDFNAKANDKISQTINHIKMVRPDLEIIEYQPGQKQRDRIIEVVATFGYKELGLKSDRILITQESSGKIYFNKNNAVLYILKNYEWSGPIYETVTTSSGETKSDATTVKKGKGLKIGIGAAAGSFLGPVGTLVGATMGAASKGKSNTQTKTISNSSETTKNVEKTSIATLTIQNLDTQKLYRLSFNCNSELDAKIKCFDFEQEKREIIEDTSLSLDGIKALKELLDMGAITQEEFEIKKKQILGI